MERAVAALVGMAAGVFAWCCIQGFVALLVWSDASMLRPPHADSCRWHSNGEVVVFPGAIVGCWLAERW